MTCRERLQIEHPERVSEDNIGGCNGCPHDYGYRAAGACLSFQNCTQCWDQEALEVEPEVLEPEVLEPEVLEPEVLEPEVLEPEVLEPENVKPARRATVYISGPITGVERYWEAFEKAEEALTNKGWVVLTPSRHPQGLTNAQYMRMDLAMIDSADVVYFLPGWENSKGAKLEKLYCEYTEKLHAESLDTFGEVRR